MSEDKSNNKKAPDLPQIDDDNYRKLIEKGTIKVPQAGDTVTGKVLSASKAEVRLDLDGILTGVVRGRELYEEAEEYADLKPGDEVEATVMEEENENGELELSFRFAGQEKAWTGLREAFEKGGIIKVKVTDANKGGLMSHYKQIQGFIPVSQLAPENYPRVNGGDKSKILERLREFAGKEFTVKVITLDEKDDKIIFSEKEAWNEKQKDIINRYQVGAQVEGTITAITDFGVFISFGENLEGLIHISELAWQRIDNPNNLYKVGDKIKAEVISLDGSKIFLSAKKLQKDPWQDVDKRYKTGQVVNSKILKVNPFGLFVELDGDIHGLAHISQLNLAPGQRISETFKAGEHYDFEIVSIEPKEHRLGLAVVGKKTSKQSGKKKEEEPGSGKIKASKDTADRAGDKKIEKKKKPKAAKDKKAEKADNKEEVKAAEKLKKAIKTEARKKPAEKAAEEKTPKDKKKITTKKK